uniref:IntS14_C domain-containing protein n=1 Tax=Ascaris lumbricoides TaxID=6252 RepID=A0A0M3IEF6_ASCLU
MRIDQFSERSAGEGEDASDGFLIALCDALAIEEMSAICHLNEQTYGVIRSVKYVKLFSNILLLFSRSQGSDDRMLVICSFPRGLSSIYWLPHLERLLPQRSAGEGEDASDGFLIALCDALAIEEMSAICHLNEQTYGVILLLFSRSQGSDDRMLVICSFPRGLSSIYWLPHLERLLPQFSNFKAVVEGNNEGVQLCAANDSLAKPSYARTPLTCWLDAQGIQADFQKVIRLLRKIPDRTVAFYSEINRMHQHACAIGAEDIMKKLTDLIEEESQLHSPIIKNHGAYVCELLSCCEVQSASRAPFASQHAVYVGFDLYSSRKAVAKAMSVLFSTAKISGQVLMFACINVYTLPEYHTICYIDENWFIANGVLETRASTKETRIVQISHEGEGSIGRYESRQKTRREGLDANNCAAVMYFLLVEHCCIVV